MAKGRGEARWPHGPASRQPTCRRWWVLGLACSLITVTGPLNAHEPGSGAVGKEMRAVRVNPAPPRIDGILDDEVWSSAPLFTGFTQRDPD